MKGNKNTLSLKEVCFSTIKAAIGLGLLYLPSSFGAVGWYGFFLIILLGFLSSVSLYLCARTTKTCGKYDFLNIGAETMGVPGKLISLFFFVSFVGGACILFFIVLSVYLKQTLFLWFVSLQSKEDDFMFNLFLFFLVFLITCCFCFIKDVRLISRIAAFGFIGIVYTLFLLIYNMFHLKDKITLPENPSILPTKFLSFFLSASFSFGNNFVYMSAIKNLENPTRKRCNFIVVICGIIETIVYAVFCGVGYYVFGNNISKCKPDDILSIGSNSSKIENVPFGLNTKEIAFFYNMGSMFMFTVILFTYPLLINPLREMILSIFLSEEKQKESLVFYGANSLLCGLVFIFSYLLGKDKATAVISYVSGICGSFLFFLLPAVFFLCTEKPFKRKNIFDITMFLLVLFTGLISFFGFICYQFFVSK